MESPADPYASSDEAFIDASKRLGDALFKEALHGKA
jgi:hypothetical protein